MVPTRLSSRTVPSWEVPGRSRDGTGRDGTRRDRTGPRDLEGPVVPTTHPHDLYEMVLEQLIVLCYQQIDQHKIGLTWTKTEMFINNRQHVENHGDIKQKYVELLTLCKYKRIKI